jgi:hypothetical protein
MCNNRHDGTGLLRYLSFWRACCLGNTGGAASPFICGTGKDMKERSPFFIFALYIEHRAAEKGS